MLEVMCTTDPVRLSFVQALLSERGIENFVFDTHSSILDGSLGVLPQRVMVADDDYAAARRVLEAAPELG